MKSKNFFLILLNCIFFVWSSTEPLVQISDGLLRGITRVTRKGRIVSSFLGIPYAQPPLEELRFQNPLPAKPWTGIRNATTDGSQCAQIDRMTKQYLGSEDCLYLNVYTPLLEFNLSSVNYAPNKTLLPVMAWIHGGEFLNGNCSSDNFGAEFLLDKNIIYVCMNYRLGILGFLSSSDSVSPGNYGLKDQVLALKWIQKNIPVFGGDPNRVTIFGESAGGVSVFLHMLSESSKGLFNQYIIQSGSALSPWTFQSRRFYKPYINTLGLSMFCSTKSTIEIINCLRLKNVTQLVHKGHLFGSFARFALLTWTPTDEEETEGAFLLDTPENLIAKGKMKNYPFISGTVKDEGLIASVGLYTNKLFYWYIRLIVDELFKFIAKYYLRIKDVHKFAYLCKQFYLNGTYWGNKNQFISGLTDFMSDVFFFYPQVKLQDIAAKTVQNPFYFYSFEYRGSFSFTSIILKNNNNIGVCHTDELTYIFPAKATTYGLQNMNYSRADKSMVDIMIDLWTSFAINGKPTSEHLLPSDLWKPYSKNKSYLQIGNMIGPSVVLKNKFLKKRMDFWKNEIMTLK